MNGWDAFTWISSAALAGSAIAIFILFLRDAGTVLRHGSDVRDEQSESTARRDTLG